MERYYSSSNGFMHKALLVSFLILANCILYSGLFAQSYYVAPGGTVGLSTSISSPGDIHTAFSTAPSGSTVHILSGNYGPQNLVVGNDSVSFIGYSNMPNDLNSYHMPESLATYYASSNWNTIYPTIDNQDRTNGGTAISAPNKDHVTIKNFQIIDANFGASFSGDYNTIENVILSGFGDPYAFYDGHGITHYGNHNNTLNCFVLNSGAEGITIKGNHNLVDNSMVYADDTTSHAPTDYYILVTTNSGTSESKYNLVKNCHAERVGNLQHSGHGLCLTTFYIHQQCSSGGGYCYNPIFKDDDVSENIYENCTTTNVGEVVLLRGPGVRNNDLIGIYSESYGGLTVTTGASFNRFEKCHIKDTYYYDNPNTSGVSFNAAVEFFAAGWGDTTDQNVSYSAQGTYPWELEVAAEGNTFTNCLFENVSSGVHLSSYSEFVDPNGNTVDRINRKIVKDNIFYNCTFSGRQDSVDCLFYAMRGNDGNKMVNCIITGFHTVYSRYFPTSMTQAVQDYHNIIPADFTYDHCNFFNNGFDSELLSNGSISGPIDPIYIGFSDSIKGEFISCNFLDPGFEDANNGDFHLVNCPGCGAIDQGLSPADMTSNGYIMLIEDYDSLARPCGLNHDLGAFEFQGNCSTIGLNKVESKSINVYPNPSSGEVYIDFGQLEGEKAITLFTLSGSQILHNETSSESIYRLNLNTLPSGIYLVNLMSEEKSWSEKLVITR